jgi:hypothetical protein
MREHTALDPTEVREVRKEALPKYEPPQVLTCRGQEILEELGPAQACSFNHSVLVCP